MSIVALQSQVGKRLVQVKASIEGGDLVAEIYQTLWEYKHTRIHSALKMPLSVFAEQIAA
jgi:hypothetical protein